MKIIKKIASLLLVASFLVCGTNFEVFAAGDETPREVSTSYQDCYQSGINMVIKEENDYYDVHSLGGTIEWQAEKTNEDMYTSCNVFARKTSPNVTNKNELCLEQGTVIKRVGISNNGWDIIQYENELYFMWYEYVVIDNPKPTIEVSQKSSNEFVADPAIKQEINEDDAVEIPEQDTSNGVFYGGFELTAYEWTGNPCADGVYPEVGYTAACNDPGLWHHWIYIEGVGVRYVHDTGGMASNVIDIYMGDYNSCIQFGHQYANIYIID